MVCVGERNDRVEDFEFDLMALWKMYINSHQPDDERSLEDYEVILSDEGTLGQLIKALKKEKVDAVTSLYMCQGNFFVIHDSADVICVTMMSNLKTL
jgi:hypothetical protein